jgi:hypothetical protein
VFDCWSDALPPRRLISSMVFGCMRLRTLATLNRLTVYNPERVEHQKVRVLVLADASSGCTAARHLRQLQGFSFDDASPERSDQATHQKPVMGEYPG